MTGFQNSSGLSAITFLFVLLEEELDPHAADDFSVFLAPHVLRIQPLARHSSFAFSPCALHIDLSNNMNFLDHHSLMPFRGSPHSLVHGIVEHENPGLRFGTVGFDEIKSESCISFHGFTFSARRILSKLSLYSQISSFHPQHDVLLTCRSI